MMKKKLKIKSLKLKVKTEGFLFLFVVSLFTLHFSLLTSSADEILSRSATVLEASTGRILYAKNPTLRLPPASTAKLMTAIVAIENKDPRDTVRISKNATSVSPLRAGFKEGDEVTVEALLYAALMKSANDAAVALAEAVAGSEKNFVNLMNEKANLIGLRDTKFINSHGLPGPDQYTTAFDLSMLMRYSLRYPKLKEIIGKRVAGVSTENGNTVFLKNTNKLLWSDDELIGGKTGYTRKARHCFVCAAGREEEAVVVTLLGSPSRDVLWKETEELIAKGFRVMANKEEPSLYFTKADYEALHVKKASYKKRVKPRVQKMKAKTGKKLIAKKTKLITKKTKLIAKKKGKTKTAAKGKNKGGKDYRVAEKDREGNGG